VREVKTLFESGFFKNVPPSRANVKNQQQILLRWNSQGAKEPVLQW